MNQKILPINDKKMSKKAEMSVESIIKYILWLLLIVFVAFGINYLLKIFKLR